MTGREKNMTGCQLIRTISGFNSFTRTTKSDIPRTTWLIFSGIEIFLALLKFDRRVDIAPRLLTF